jgi:predicted nucleic acid-binding Zn ribbon protein
MLNLRNPFPEYVRLLYLYNYECFECGSNKNLELHHIFGRISASAFNACPLCHNCHEAIKHDFETHLRLLKRVITYHHNNGYKLMPAYFDTDIGFFKKVLAQDFRFGPLLEQFLSKLCDVRTIN